MSLMSLSTSSAEQTARQASVSQTPSLSRTLGAAVAAGLLGVFILFGVGFAGPSTIHNAAHDSRHSFAFPCH